MKKYFLVLLFLVIIFPVSDLKASSKNNIIKQFKTIRTKTTWPVKGTNYDYIVSAFGPRWIQQYTCRPETHDWHQGLDIYADKGTPVRAVAKGTVWKITEYSGAGNTIILRHKLPDNTKFHNKKIKNYYTWYSHLDTYEESLVEGDEIKKGKVIGYVGDTGNANTPHLHLELHIGTPWSLETQLSLSESSVYRLGFDSAVNSMLLFEPGKKSVSLTKIQDLTADQDGLIYYSSSDDQPLLNKVKFVIKNKNKPKGERVVKKHVLNLNYRTGYDATSTEGLDTSDITKPYISPILVSFYQDSYRTGIVIPKDYAKKYLDEKYERILYVYDIWGRSKKIDI